MRSLGFSLQMMGRLLSLNGTSFRSATSRGYRSCEGSGGLQGAQEDD